MNQEAEVRNLGFYVSDLRSMPGESPTPALPKSDIETTHAHPKFDCRIWGHSASAQAGVPKAGGAVGVRRPMPNLNPTWRACAGRVMGVRIAIDLECISTSLR